MVRNPGLRQQVALVGRIDKHPGCDPVAVFFDRGQPLLEPHRNARRHVQRRTDGIATGGNVRQENRAAAHHHLVFGGGFARLVIAMDVEGRVGRTEGRIAIPRDHVRAGAIEFDGVAGVGVGIARQNNGRRF